MNIAQQLIINELDSAILAIVSLDTEIKCAMLGREHIVLAAVRGIAISLVLSNVPMREYDAIIASLDIKGLLRSLFTGETFESPEGSLPLQAAMVEVAWYLPKGSISSAAIAECNALPMDDWSGKFAALYRHAA